VVTQNGVPLFFKVGTPFYVGKIGKIKGWNTPPRKANQWKGTMGEWEYPPKCVKICLRAR